MKNINRTDVQCFLIHMLSCQQFNHKWSQLAVCSEVTLMAIQDEWLKLCTLLDSCIVCRKRICVWLIEAVAKGQGWLGGGAVTERIASIQSLPT